MKLVFSFMNQNQYERSVKVIQVKKKKMLKLSWLREVKSKFGYAIYYFIDNLIVDENYRKPYIRKPNHWKY